MIPRLAVEFAGVTAGYRHREVLHDIDLTVQAGERVAIVGPNGAGKSTLLRALAGIVPPTSGTIRLLGDPIERLDRPAIARRLAVVPQQAVLPFAVRVEDVVALGRLPHEDALRGMRAADRAAVASAIRRVGLEHLVGRDARELSLGERQLVLLALAVAQGSPVLVLDEPTVHLDLHHQVAVMTLLSGLHERDATTVIAVLHDLALARHFFPRVIVLADGRIAADGPPRDALAPARIRDVFRVDPVLVGLGAVAEAAIPPL